MYDPSYMRFTRIRNYSQQCGTGGRDGRSKTMRNVLLLASKGLYVVSTLALVALAFGFVIYAGWNIWTALTSGRPLLADMLSTIGLVIIALAVSDVGRFMLEEELAGDKDLDRTSEVRRTLAKFLTIIIIAASLEALVFIIEAGHSGEGELLWPILLLAVVALLLVCLGLYQRLLHSAEHERRVDKDEGRDVEPEGEEDGGGPVSGR